MHGGSTIAITCSFNDCHHSVHSRHMCYFLVFMDGKNNLLNVDDFALMNIFNYLHCNNWEVLLTFLTFANPGEECLVSFISYWTSANEWWC